MVLSPSLIALLFAIGVGIITFFAIPGQQRISFDQPGSKLNFRERIHLSLREAGLFDRSPSIIALICIGAATVISLLLLILFGKVYYIAAGPILVFMAFRYYMMSKQRRFMTDAYEELVPFLNRISTSVKSGLPVQRAYLGAVEDSDVLGKVLGDSASKISSGAEFVPALLETIPLLPIRMWANFVRQLELHEQVGGDIGQALQTTTDQISKSQRLQAETRADFSMMQKQQQVIMAILGFGVFGMFFLLPGASDRFTQTFSSPVGIIMSIIGVFIMVSSVMFIRSQLIDIERKIHS